MIPMSKPFWWQRLWWKITDLVIHYHREHYPYCQQECCVDKGGPTQWT